MTRPRPMLRPVRSVRFLSALLPLLLAATAQAEVTVTDAWARATVPGQSGSGAFMTITSSAGGQLLSASSPVAANVEVHEMAIDSTGVMRMREIPSLALPAGQAVQLTPGGYHIMFMGLKEQLKAGATIPLSLKVQEDGQTQTLDVSVTVRPLNHAAGQGGHAHGHDHKPKAPAHKH